MEFEPIVNKVAESDLVTLDLETLWDDREIVELDIAPFLWKGLVLKEKDFRQSVADLDEADFAAKHVAVFCSTAAVIPTWAYMLVAVKLGPVAATVSHGSSDEAVRTAFVRTLENHDWEAYTGRNVIVKGCPSDVVPIEAYITAVTKLQETAKKVLYGEACSSVPVWRRPAASRNATQGVPVQLPRRS